MRTRAWWIAVVLAVAASVTVVAPAAAVAAPVPQVAASAAPTAVSPLRGAPPLTDDGYVTAAASMWAGTGVSVAGVECKAFRSAATVFCVESATAGAAYQECSDVQASNCGLSDYRAVEALECTPYPAGLGVVGRGGTLCVNSAAMRDWANTPPAAPEQAGVDFQCGFADPLCALQEDQVNGTVTLAIENIRGALSNTAFTTDGALWVGAATEFSWWRWVVVLVTILAMAFGITVGLLKQDGVMVRQAAIGGVLAWPLAELAVWTLGHLLNVTEMLSGAVLNRGPDQSLDLLLFELSGEGGTQVDRWAAGWTSIILLIGAFFLTFVFAFRNLALMVLVAFAPLAFMMAPVRPGRQVIATWAAAVLALLLTKPLTLGLIALILNTGTGLTSLWTPEAMPLLFGLVLSLFMPFLAFSLFDFVGTQAAGATEGVGRSMASSGIRGGQTASRQVGAAMRNRPRLGSGGGGGGAAKALGPGGRNSPSTGGSGGGGGGGGGSSASKPSPVSTSGGRGSGPATSPASAGGGGAATRPSPTPTGASRPPGGRAQPAQQVVPPPRKPND